MIQLRPFSPLDLSLSVDVAPPLGRLFTLTLAASYNASCTPRLCLAEHSVKVSQSPPLTSDVETYLDIFPL